MALSAQTYGGGLVSTLDLFHLSLTNQELYSLILKSEPVFNCLKSVALCDGRGFKVRQEFQSIYELQPCDYVWGDGRNANYDEEVEVRVWNLKCDSTNGLPCIKCGINVYEECRYVPRQQELPGMHTSPKPHRVPSAQVRNIMAFCALCDSRVEHGLPLSLSEYCNCDHYTRWICLPCKVKERHANRVYFRRFTKDLHEDTGNSTEIRAGLWRGEPGNIIGFWCICGERAPEDGHIRCSWCKRRHDVNNWFADDSSFIPFFENDPCYPKIRRAMGQQIMYPL